MNLISLLVAIRLVYEISQKIKEMALFGWILCSIATAICTSRNLTWSSSGKITNFELNNMGMGSSARPNELPPLGRPMREEFFLDPEFIQLNHGSYGTYPKDVQTALHSFQLRAERNVDRWMRVDLWNELTNVRRQLAKYLNADDPDDLVVVPNTTGGMNAVFRSIKFQKGDKILHFNTVYDAMRALVQYIVDTNEGNVSMLQFPANYPISNAQLVQNFATFLDANHSENSRIRIAIIDHISSVPGVRNPIEQLIPLLKAKNILIVIDGAHAIGQIPIDIQALDVDYYITNCHKWLYAARGTAVMYVKKQHQAGIHPASISVHYTQPANFQKEFWWTGTMDFSAYMTVPAAIAFRSKIGEETLRNYTHDLAVKGGALVALRLGTSVLQTEDQIANMVDVMLPVQDTNNPQANDPKYWENALLNRFNMYVSTYKHNGKIWARFSAQIYNDLSDFEKAAVAYKTLCAELNGLDNKKVNGTK